MAFLELPPQTALTVPTAGHVSDSEPVWRARTFSIPTYQWVLFTGKRVRFQRGKHRLDARTGDFLVLRPNEIHTGWGEPDPESGFYWVRFWPTPPPREVPQSVVPAHPSLGTEPLVVPDWGHLAEAGPAEALTAAIVHEWRERAPFHQVRIKALLTELLVEVARKGAPYPSEGVALHADAPGMADAVLRTMEYLREHFTEQLTSREIERQIGYTYPYLCRIFRRATGMTMRTYLHRLRIGRARDLLLDYSQHLSIRQVAEAVGYEDPAYFSRVFREVAGASPKRFVKLAYTS